MPVFGLLRPRHRSQTNREKLLARQRIWINSGRHGAQSLPTQVVRAKEMVTRVILLNHATFEQSHVVFLDKNRTTIGIFPSKRLLTDLYKAKCYNYYKNKWHIPLVLGSPSITTRRVCRV